MSRRHIGAGMDIVPELLLRQVLLEGLVELAGDDFRQEELFARADDMLQGTQEDWLVEMRAALLRMTDVAAPDGIKVGVGYPDLDARMPYVSIVSEDGREDEGGAVLADILGKDTHVYREASGTDPDAIDFVPAEVEDRIVKGGEWVTTFQVGSWTEVPEESVLLHSVVKHLIFRHKGRLSAAGFREITLAETGFQPDAMMAARTGYVPVVRCTLRWAWRQTERRARPTYWRGLRPSKTNTDL